MIDIPEHHMCLKANEKGGCVCKTSPTKLVSCKYIVPAREAGEQVNIDPQKTAKRRQEMTEAFEEVQTCLHQFQAMHEALGAAPLDSTARRKQQKAFHELGAAQHRLSEAFTFVPPKAPT